MDPNNGTVSCLVGDDGVLSYEDICSYMCDTGYELTGSESRTCQSDGSWNGTDAMCSRGMYKVHMHMKHFFTSLVQCLPLTNPNNGMITCSLGDDMIHSYEDTCSFTCNTGYELTGSDTRICQSDGNWSGNMTMCERGKMSLYVYHNLITGLATSFHFITTYLMLCHTFYTTATATMHMVIT